MAERKWGLITNGVTFEALATALIFFEDPNAALFGRRGKDGGQDARSGDRRRVFQAKHHEDGRAATAIGDAKKEAAKIRDYRQQGHTRHEQWKDVTHWRLVTNTTFNPTDRQTWDNEVVPLFARQGLSADYWERANLDALLDRHHEVNRSFFENETRALLSLPEIRDRLPAHEPFLQRDSFGGFFGRDAEVRHVRDFLSSNELFLVVHGAGGIGKTRLLIEAGEEIASEGTWQVLWANVASMASTGAWFETIIPERQTLLLVDEPPDEQLLQQLSEQLGGRVGRLAKWKVLVAVRSPKDPVLRFLFAARMKPSVRELAINALPDPAAEAMCIDLLKSGPLAGISGEQQQAAARELSRRFSRHPVWLTLAVHMLESRGDLSKVAETAQELADQYLEEIFASQKHVPVDQVRSLLRWVALLRTVNRDDDSSVRFLAEGSDLKSPTAIRGQLASLVSRRVLIERGASKRLVELKPDVLCDHILLRWLTVNVGYGDSPIEPSDDAKALVTAVRNAPLSGNVSPLGRTILASIARTELILRLGGQNVALLDAFFKNLEKDAATMSASQRIALAQVLLTLAAFRPIDTAAVLGAMRASVAETETVDRIFDTQEIKHDDVVLELGWPLFHAAMGAQTPEAQERVLAELCRLAEAEAEISVRRAHGLPNDGRRAADLVTRTLEGGPQFWGDFEDVARVEAERLLAAIAKTPPTAAHRALLKALVQPVIAVERRQTWSDENVVRFQRYIITPDDPAWSTRETILAAMKDLVASDSVPTETRKALWHVFAEAHGSVNRSRGRSFEETNQKLRAQLLEDLTWAGRILSSRIPDIAELAAARELWDWHSRYEKDAEIKALADELEQLYASNELAAEFEPLLSRDDWEQREPRAIAKAAELAASESSAATQSFVERAIRFTRDTGQFYELMGVAWQLGTHALASEAVRVFARGALQQSTVTPSTDFGTMAAASWTACLRKSATPTAAFDTVVELMDLCGSDTQRLNFALRLYGGLPRPGDIGDLSPQEHALLRSLGPLFQQQGRTPAFVAAVAVTLPYEWPALRLIIEGALDSAPSDQIGAALASLIDGIFWATRKLAVTPPDLGQWMLEQLLRLQDIDSLGGNAEWYLGETLQKVGRAPLTWLPAALRARKELETKDGYAKVKAISHHTRLSQYVTKVSESDATDDSVQQAIREILDLADDHGSTGYSLPAIIGDIDPDGLVAPQEIASRFSAATTHEEVRRLARIGGAYAVGSTAWRAVARPVLIAEQSSAEERRSSFSALSGNRTKSWSAARGEVPVLFVRAVETAKKDLAAEQDAVFRPFWEWRLAVAEAELRQQEEEAKEERGE